MHNKVTSGQQPGQPAAGAQPNAPVPQRSNVGDPAVVGGSNDDIPPGGLHKDRFDLSKYKGLDIVSFDMRELNGRDSLAAQARAGAGLTPGVPVNGWVLNTEHKNHCIADAISHINGREVVNPFLVWQDYNLKTQEFIVEVYDFLNTNPKADVDDFRSRVLGIAPPTASPGSGASAST